jgi:hypothetical protein
LEDKAVYVALQRYLTLALAALLLTLGAFYTVRYFQKPDLYPGDRIEERQCRWCGGTGQDKEMQAQAPELGDVCRACSGHGQVDVIVPGPDRPTKIAGVVADSQWDNPLATADDFRAPPEFGASAEEHRRKAHTLADCTIILRKSGGDETELTSNEFGFFNTKLAPGSYIIEAKADGYESIRGEFEVPPLTEPIWLERANILDEPKTDAHAQSLYGLNLLVTLNRPGSEAGRIALTAGTP